MKKLVGLLAAVLLLAGGLVLGNPKPCYAGLCFDVRCLNSSICGLGCVCLKRGTEPMGHCYSID